MLYGFDLSHHNGKNALNDCIKNYPYKSDFFILKATEGKNYIDPNMKLSTEYVLESGKLLGLYHFCRADNGNTPLQEAQHFYQTVKPYLGQAILIADFEGNSLKIDHPGTWLSNFCYFVEEMAGVKPIVYLQYSDLNKFKECQQNNYGLWVAKWGPKPQLVNPWKFFALWQYTNRYSGKNLDANIFNGDEQAFTQYMKVKKPTPDQGCGTCHCGCSYCKNE